MTNIAVVIPCFNLGRYLPEALESVLGQSRPASEIVVVDDGSTDLHTRQVLATIQYPGTRLVRTPNRGVSIARNHGVALTSAEYLVTLDADDRLEPEYLAKTAARLDADPALGFVSTGIQAFGEASYTWRPPPCTVVNALVRGTVHPASMFRREMWKAIGGYDEAFELLGCEDLDFWLSAMEFGYVGEVLDETLLQYRVRANSTYQTLVSRGGQFRVMQALFRKHSATISNLGPDVLIEKDRFLDEHRDHQAMLLQRRSALQGELEAIDAEIARTAAELTRRGSPRFDWGELGRQEPFSRVARADRGTPLDQYFLRAFLRQYAADLSGEVLGVGNSGVLDALGADIPAVRHIADLAQLRRLPDERFDCVVAGDILKAAPDVGGTLADMRRILRPGAVLLCGLPAARAGTGTRLDDGDLWRFTEATVRRLFAELFALEAFSVQVCGNVMVCAASLAGLAAEELEAPERDFVDPMFPLIYCVRAVKA